MTWILITFCTLPCFLLAGSAPLCIVDSVLVIWPRFCVFLVDYLFWHCNKVEKKIWALQLADLGLNPDCTTDLWSALGDAPLWGSVSFLVKWGYKCPPQIMVVIRSREWRCCTTLCHWIAQLTIIKVQHFMLCIFYHNLKKYGCEN